MNNKKFLIFNIVIIIITSIIAIVLPLTIKNVTAFLISFIIYILYGILGILFNHFDKKQKLKHEIKKIPIYFYYYFFLILFYVSTIFNKFIYIDTNFLVMVYLILGLILFIIIYLLHFSINSLIKKETTIDNKIANNNLWISNLELILKDDLPSNTKEKIVELYELIKYSDPTSNEQTNQIDVEITTMIESLSEKISDELINRIIKKVNKRKKMIINK